MKTIVKMRVGSHLYGTSTPASDVDYKGVYIPDAEQILLQRVKDSMPDPQGKPRVKEFGEKNKAGDVDSEFYSLQRFLSLVAEGQTIGIDMIFAPKEAVVESSPLWDYIVEHRDRLLNKDSAAFVGYCNSQAAKYSVKGERLAAARAAMELFREEWNNRGSQAKVQEVDRERLEALCTEHEWCNLLELPMGRDQKLGWFFEVCGRKISLTTSVKVAFETCERIVNNYGKRAQIAEENTGVDWKALSHAVRVATEAIELMRTGKVTFPLPNREHVLAIKTGQIPYEEVTQEIESLRKEVEKATLESILPEEPDYEFINGLVLREYRKSVMTARWRRVEVDGLPKQPGYYWVRYSWTDGMGETHTLSDIWQLKHGEFWDGENLHRSACHLTHYCPRPDISMPDFE
jgi:hypothetical protein